ncbi:MAG TPA: class IV adenylate cyclase [Gemmatimonadaceae bacterium]|nr:class IV adenylate cyclase [Gemmatimonadaceae bacterium]
MREVELKAVVPDVDALRARLAAAGATRTYVGALEDRRYDTPDRSLFARDEVLRIRVYRPADGAVRAFEDRKGPTEYASGYKVREEHSTSIEDLDAHVASLESRGFEVTREIDRDIEMFSLGAATVRIERYPRLDVLVEVEGTPEAIEHAIAQTGLLRSTFTTGRLTDFAEAFQARTGVRAALSARELRGDYRYREDQA